MTPRASSGKSSYDAPVLIEVQSGGPFTVDNPVVPFTGQNIRGNNQAGSVCLGEQRSKTNAANHFTHHPLLDGACSRHRI